MATFRSRFAATQDLMLVFSVCAFFVYAWSILIVLREVPALRFRLNTWDLIGMLAYTQASALIESILVLLALVLVGAILPARFFRDKFVAQASMVVLVSSAWVILAHYHGEITGLRQLGLWLGTYLVALGVAYGLVQRYRKLDTLIYSFVNRLTVLSSVYVAGGLLSVIIVIVRNV